MEHRDKNTQAEEELLPRRRVGWGTRIVLVLMVVALIGGSAAGMWIGLADYFRYRGVGWEGLAHQGDEALMTSDYEMALYYYGQAIEQEPNHPDNASIYAGMGTAHYYSGDFQSAMLSFRKALDLDPDHWGALYSMGVIYHYHFQDYSQAAVIWEKLQGVPWGDAVIEDHIEELLAEAVENLQQIR